MKAAQATCLTNLPKPDRKTAKFPIRVGHPAVITPIITDRNKMSMGITAAPISLLASTRASPSVDNIFMTLSEFILIRNKGLKDNGKKDS